MSAAEAPAPSITVVTWNIHGGVGADRRCDLGRVLAHLQALSPDIAALQEVDGRTHLGRQARAFERIADGLGPHVAEARLTGAGERAYGHLLWSRWPMESAVVRILPGGRVEPRAVIDATLRTPRGPLRVLATHFGLVPRDRRRQAAFLTDLAAGSPIPTLALGDFNDWRLARGSVHRSLEPVMPRFATTRTWPAGRPMVTMDRIYASKAIRIRAARAASEAAPASDHLPLVVEFDFAG